MEQEKLLRVGYLNTHGQVAMVDATQPRQLRWRKSEWRGGIHNCNSPRESLQGDASEIRKSMALHLGMIHSEA